MNKKLTRRELFELALNSSDATVKQAMEKLLFTVTLAHGNAETENFRLHTYHYGIGVGVPANDEMTTIHVAWENDKFSLRSTENYMFVEGQAGDYIRGEATAYYTLIEDRLYGT